MDHVNTLLDLISEMREEIKKLKSKVEEETSAKDTFYDAYKRVKRELEEAEKQNLTTTTEN